jgi:hypothetical protein
MAKSQKTATATVSEKTAISKLSYEEKMAIVQPFLFHQVEVTKGKKFPIGDKYDCVKIGINKWGYPFCLLSIDGEEVFSDPANLKALKPFAPAKAALAKAAVEASSDATLIVSGTIKAETQGKKDGKGSVLLVHHNWYKPRFIPKSLISKVGEHEDGVQSLFEIPAWKVKADGGPRDVADLEALQEGFQKMLTKKAK